MKNLTEKALLVNLNISQWSARKYDRKVTDEVNKNHNATDSGRFNKMLIAKDHLTEINKLANEARNFHYENTLPWSDQGERLLPSANYFEYTTQLMTLKNNFEFKVIEFIREYPSMVEEAKTRLNGMFNQADYPNDISDRFQIKTVFMPMPQVVDFRIDLGATEVDAIRAQIEGEVSKRFADATKDIYDRIAKQLKAMHERLSQSDAVFRDSLFENLKSLIDLLPRLNISGDQNINALCEDLKSLQADPDNVRTDKALRAKKANEVNDLLKNLDAFLKP